MKKKQLRRRIAGRLDHGPRGMVIITGADDRPVIENQDIEPDLIGQPVSPKAPWSALDRLKVDWIGEEGATV